MLSPTHKILSKLEIPNNLIKKINNNISSSSDFKTAEKFIQRNTSMLVSTDQTIIKGYKQDWSNIKGYADILVRPKNKLECAISMYIFYKINISITISAGRTNLTGSATPLTGAIISTEKMITNNFSINLEQNRVISDVGTILEDFRKKVKKESKQKLYYPVDPTSRKDATVGGTISCNASGFIPGKRGTTRHWVSSLSIVLTSGRMISAKKGQYLSKNGKFLVDNKEVVLPSYTRPEIKNASGPFSFNKVEVDIIDLIIGSEGIFGMIVECELILDKLPKNSLDFFIPFINENTAISFRNYIYKIKNKENFIINAFEYFGYNCQKYMANNDYFFDNNDQVAIYMQIPIYDLNIEGCIDRWFKILKNFSSLINMDKVILLNDKRNWDLFFNARHSIPVNALEKTIKLDSVSMITDTIVPENKFSIFLKYTHKLITSYNIEYLLFGHLGDCHLHFHLIHTKQKQKIAEEIYRKIIKKSSELGGVYSAEHGTGKRKRNDFIECYGIEASKQVKLCKKFFDPKMLLNRGNIV
jgi:D-lactate dehydrogenase (cytochrome)